MHARLIIGNLFKPWATKLDTSAFAWVTYTYPEVATFGKRQKTLQREGVPYEVISQDLTNDDRAIIEEYRHGMIQLFVRGEKLLGGTIVAPYAGEMVHELILALQQGVPVSALIAKTYPYPTATRANKNALGEYVLGRSLTTRSKTLLRFLYALFG